MAAALGLLAISLATSDSLMFFVSVGEGGTNVCATVHIHMSGQLTGVRSLGMWVPGNKLRASPKSKLLGCRRHGWEILLDQGF